MLKEVELQRMKLRVAIRQGDDDSLSFNYASINNANNLFNIKPQ